MPRRTRPPEASQPLVHRVVCVTPAGITTLGDNNVRQDPFVLRPEQIQGQVVAAWRGQKRRKIAGGLRGRLKGRALCWGLGFYRKTFPALTPLYASLSRRGWIARLLPRAFRPRIVAYHVRGQDHYQLLLGRRVIGRYDNRLQEWQIQRPYHLIVEGRTLRGPQDRNRSNRKELTDRRQAMNQPHRRNLRYQLTLADGCRWEIEGGDEEAAALVALLGGSMQLDGADNVASSSARGDPYRLLVQMDTHSLVADCYVPLASKNNGTVVCILSPSEQWGGPFTNLVRLSLILAREAQARGGLLLHGALAEKDGQGVILTAPGGTGKSTASRRFPAPWCSLSDDTTLVVRDSQGCYWAHPWPTWSRFQNEGPGGTWNVQRAVPLAAIFVLIQAEADEAEPVGPGHAVSLLVESLKQATQFMPIGLYKEEVRTLHLEGFNTLCGLVRAVPAHLLHISLTGAFWKEIERVMGRGKP